MPVGTTFSARDSAGGTATSVSPLPDATWMALAMVRREVPDGAEVVFDNGVGGRVLARDE